MLHFRYFFTEIKTQTSSLILFGARQEKKFLKDNRHASHKDFLFIAVEKERSEEATSPNTEIGNTSLSDQNIIHNTYF